METGSLGSDDADDPNDEDFEDLKAARTVRKAKSRPRDRFYEYPSRPEMYWTNATAINLSEHKL
jgi:hypothetical protein